MPPASQPAAPAVANIREALAEVFRGIDARARRPMARRGTGFPRWDACTAGLHPGELTVVTGGAGSGKTTLALAVASSLLHEGQAVLFLSTESTAAALAEMLLAQWAGVELLGLRSIRLE